MVGSRMRLTLGTVFVLALGALPAHAQYSTPGSATEMFSSAGDQSVQARYNKAKKGSSINEWARHLNDPDPEVRLDAVKSFGDSNDPKAIDYLVGAVGDPDPRVQAKAVDYLGKLHAADSTPFLIQKLFTVGTKEKLRHRILMTLGKIGDPRASQPILQFVRGARDPDTRGAGIYAIGEIGDMSIHQELASFGESESDPRLKRLASDALMKIATRVPAPQRKDPNSFPDALGLALQVEKKE